MAQTGIRVRARSGTVACGAGCCSKEKCQQKQLITVKHAEIAKKNLENTKTI